MSFARGRSGNPNGRPKGARSKRTTEIQQVAKGLLEDADYQAALRQRLIACEASAVEILLYHYCYGRPIEKYEDVSPPERIQVCWDEGPRLYLPGKDGEPDHDGNGHAPVIPSTVAPDKPSQAPPALPAELPPSQEPPQPESPATNGSSPIPPAIPRRPWKPF
jgi:hypothetical protein